MAFVEYLHPFQKEKCLSQSKEYNQLNKIACVHAMKKKFSFLKMEPSAAGDLAQRFYKAVSAEPKMNQILEESDVSRPLISRQSMHTNTS